jgi:hypothetical protein
LLENEKKMPKAKIIVAKVAKNGFHLKVGLTVSTRGNFRE